MRYLDIDVILAEEERLPCIFPLECAYLGQLDQTSQESQQNGVLPADSKVDLPLWLAQGLAAKGMVDVENPKHYNAKMRNEITAGPNAIKYRSYSKYYFEVGLKLSNITSLGGRRERDEDLMKILRDAFSQRFLVLMSRSLSSIQDESAEYMDQLTASELKIFLEGINAAKDKLRWRRGLSSLLEKSVLLGKKSITDRDDREEDMRSKRLKPHP